jgi:hypothetical protein
LLKKHTDRNWPSSHRQAYVCVVLGVLLLVNLLISGCSRLIYSDPILNDSRLPRNPEVKAVPFYPQKKFQCGPAALAMALGWSGLQISPDTLAHEVFTPTLKGSYQSALIGATRRHGKLAYLLNERGNLFQEVAAGHPVIVLQNLGLSWSPKWHYAVAIGFDLDRRTILLHSGTTPRKTTAIAVFESTWKRGDYWGLLVLPPGELPATGELTDVLPAVVALEKAGQWPAAIKGYTAVLRRWPSAMVAHIGLGNSWYALGNLDSAASVLRNASLLFPKEGTVFNNLAHVLFEQGNIDAAEQAARQAVNLGGPLLDSYQKTLIEIQAGKADRAK